MRQVLLLNAGRIGSYMILAGLVAAVGTVLITPFAADMLRSVGAGLMVFIGLYVGGWVRSALAIERFARRLLVWSSGPLGKVINRDGSKHGVLLWGLLWGAMPCGMVHSTILWAATSAGPLEAAVAMFAFGCGTLPAMLAAGVASRQLQQFLGHIRPVAAAMLIAFGVLTFPPVQHFIFGHTAAHVHSHAAG